MAEDDAPSVAEVGSHAGTVDVTGGIGLGVEDLERPDVTGDHPDSSRRYGGPMIHQYKFLIVILLVSLALLVVALFTSTKSLQQSNEALALASSVENQMLTLINDSTKSDVTVEPHHPEELVETITTPDPTPNPTAPPTPKPSSQPTSAAPTKPHPLNPKWYQTTHADYQFFVEKNSDGSNHDWHLSNMLCSKQNRILCSYETYCPGGQGGAPFGGGPPKLHNWASIKETQWAPYLDLNPNKEPSGSHWVQVGIMSNDDGGNNENGYVQCWKYDDWYGGEGLDIVEKWEDEHRVWTLCCEQADATEGGGDV